MNDDQKNLSRQELLNGDWSKFDPETYKTAVAEAGSLIEAFSNKARPNIIAKNNTLDSQGVSSILPEDFEHVAGYTITKTDTGFDVAFETTPERQAPMLDVLAKTDGVPLNRRGGEDSPFGSIETPSHDDSALKTILKKAFNALHKAGFMTEAAKSEAIYQSTDAICAYDEDINKAQLRAEADAKAAQKGSMRR